MADRPTVGLIGAGRAAGVVGVVLAEAGYDVVAVGSRTDASAEAVSALVRGAGAAGCRAMAVQEVADTAELVLVTTNDGAIGSVVSELTWRAGQAVVHCSGALSAEALAPAGEAGALIGSWHPFQTLTGQATLKGATFGIEADEPLFGMLSDMTVAVGGSPLPVPAEARVLYHAASVLSCGYLTTLLWEAGRLWEQAGLPADAAMPAIAAIAEATLANVRALGPGATMTGPTSRGDLATVRLHLDSVAKAAPELLPLYTAISSRSVALAHEAGRPTNTTDEWDALFAEYGSVRQSDR
jgi:predicted short-subunit dehydrogenase-like oxidoreductase (DUF2520 family)